MRRAHRVLKEGHPALQGPVVDEPLRGLELDRPLCPGFRRNRSRGTVAVVGFGV